MSGLSGPSHCHRSSYLVSHLIAADFHVAIDGNFHHRHLRGAGVGPKLQDFESDYFVPQATVDAVAARIKSAKANSKGKRREYQPRVPESSLAGCKESFKAAHDHNDEQLEGRYDVNGIMGMCCRHGAPLFFANITTPGEQQHYAIALIEHLFSFLPPNTRLAALYDIGCQLDYSLNIVSHPLCSH